MESMFEGCFSLNNLYLSNFNTTNTENMKKMFKDINFWDDSSTHWILPFFLDPLEKPHSSLD
jgi:surface protein